MCGTSGEFQDFIRRFSNGNIVLGLVWIHEEYVGCISPLGIGDVAHAQCIAQVNIYRPALVVSAFGPFRSHLLPRFLIMIVRWLQPHPMMYSYRNLRPSCNPTLAPPVPPRIFAACQVTSCRQPTKLDQLRIDNLSRDAALGRAFEPALLTIAAIKFEYAALDVHDLRVWAWSGF